MIQSFALLLTCQLAGEIVARASGIPVPGPVLGLVLLFCGLQVFARGRSEAVESAALGRTTRALLHALALLFVPAGVGVIQHAGVFGQHGLTLVLAVLASTLITLVATAAVFLGVKRMTSDGEADR